MGQAPLQPEPNNESGSRSLEPIAVPGGSCFRCDKRWDPLTGTLCVQFDRSSPQNRQDASSKMNKSRKQKGCSSKSFSSFPSESYSGDEEGSESSSIRTSQISVPVPRPNNVEVRENVETSHSNGNFLKKPKKVQHKKKNSSKLKSSYGFKTSTSHQHAVMISYNKGDSFILPSDNDDVSEGDLSLFNLNPQKKAQDPTFFQDPPRQPVAEPNNSINCLEQRNKSIRSSKTINNNNVELKIGISELKPEDQRAGELKESKSQVQLSNTQKQSANEDRREENKLGMQIAQNANEDQQNQNLQARKYNRIHVSFKRKRTKKRSQGITGTDTNRQKSTKRAATHMESGENNPQNPGASHEEEKQKLLRQFDNSSSRERHPELVEQFKLPPPELPIKQERPATIRANNKSAARMRETPKNRFMKPSNHGQASLKQSSCTSQDSSDNQKEENDNQHIKSIPNIPKDQYQFKQLYVRSGSRANMRRVQASLTRKAQEIALRQKNFKLSFWNLFVVDSGLPYTNDYKKIKKIGSGGCGEVFMVMHLPTDQIRAMKVISKSSGNFISSVYDEVNVLKGLDHPHIVKVFEYFTDASNIYIVMEYLKGGSILDRMAVIGRFGERESALIIKQVFSALNYLQQKKMVHRDLKLENILFTNEESLNLKIVDFGSSVNTESPAAKNSNRIVTSYYVAPEIALKEDYISKCDVFSCGVVLYIILSGYLPFKGNTDQEIIEKICKGLVNFDDHFWKNVSSKVKSLIRDMLDINAQTRINFPQCIDSPWIKMLTKVDSSGRVEGQRLAKVLNSLNEFQEICKLRTLALHYSLSYFGFQNSVEKLTKIFLFLDVKFNGQISEKDLTQIASRMYRDTDQQQLYDKHSQIVQKLDFRHEQSISYSDFLVATLDFQKVMTSQKIQKLFGRIDINKDGFITPNDLQHFTNKELSLDQCQVMIHESLSLFPDQASPVNLGDLSKASNLKLSFSQFKAIILNQGLTVQAQKMSMQSPPRQQQQNVAYPQLENHAKPQKLLTNKHNISIDIMKTPGSRESSDQHAMPHKNPRRESEQYNEASQVVGKLPEGNATSGVKEPQMKTPKSEHHLMLGQQQIPPHSEIHMKEEAGKKIFPQQQAAAQKARPLKKRTMNKQTSPFQPSSKSNQMGDSQPQQQQVPQSTQKRKKSGHRRQMKVVSNTNTRKIVLTPDINQ